MSLFSVRNKHNTSGMVKIFFLEDDTAESESSVHLHQSWGRLGASGDREAVNLY